MTKIWPFEKAKVDVRQCGGITTFYPPLEDIANTTLTIYKFPYTLWLRGYIKSLRGYIIRYTPSNMIVFLIIWRQLFSLYYKSPQMIEMTVWNLNRYTLSKWFRYTALASQKKRYYMIDVNYWIDVALIFFIEIKYFWVIF